jgi:hypothetical protein
MTEYKVTLVMYDESGTPYALREDGRFQCSEGQVVKVTEGLDEIVKEGDSLSEVHRKLSPPYYRVEEIH